MFCKKCGYQLKIGAKFCTNCGAAFQADSMKLQNEQKAQSQAIPYEATVQKIIGNNQDYYLPNFKNMCAGMRSQMNWASLFGGIIHADYRNMWHEWFNIMSGPLIGEVFSLVIAAVTLLLHLGQFSLVMLSSAITCACLRFIFGIPFAADFNKLYMKHVQNKVAQHDFSPDPSTTRMVVMLLVILICMIAEITAFIILISLGLS